MMFHYMITILFGLGFVFCVVWLLRELFRKDIQNALKIKQAVKVGILSWITLLMLTYSYTFYKNSYSTWFDYFVSLLVQAILFMPFGIGMFLNKLVGWAWQDKLRELNKK